MKVADLEAIEAALAQRGYRCRFRNGTPGDEWDYLPDLETDGALDAETAAEWAIRLEAVARFKGFRDVAVVGPDLEPVEVPLMEPAASILAVNGLHAVPIRNPNEPWRAVSTDQTQTSLFTPTQNPSAVRRFGKLARTAAEVEAAALAAAPDDAGQDETTPAPLVVDPELRYAVEGIPLGGGLTVLATEGATLLVGDDTGQVYSCQRESVEGRVGVSWRPKVKRFEHVVMGVGSDGRGAGAEIPWLTWTTAGGGVSARAAHFSPGGGQTGLWFVRR